MAIETQDLTTPAESVRDVIERIDAAAVVFTTLIGKSQASAMKEEYPERAYLAPRDAPQFETGSAPAPTPNQPVMQKNAIETISRTASASTASDAVRKYGMDEVLADDVEQQLIGCRRDEEYACIGIITEPTADPNFISTGVTGGLEDPGTYPARRISFHGLLNAAVRDQTGGAFSEGKVRTLKQVIFENTRERADKVMLVTPADQVIADDFSGKIEAITNVAGAENVGGAATRVRTVAGNEVDISVQYFRDSFGRTSVVPSTFLKSDTAIIFDPQMCDICELEPLQAQMLYPDTAKKRERECFLRSTLRVLNTFSGGTMENLS